MAAGDSPETHLENKMYVILTPTLGLPGAYMMYFLFGGGAEPFHPGCSPVAPSGGARDER